ncbi:MAG TPA: DUF2256 domain-containing protein [Marinagarivorans sp.]
MHKKLNLPVKICPVCKRPFNWRKRWAKNWQQVVYCSKRCKTQKATMRPDDLPLTHDSTDDKTAKPERRVC